MPHELAIFELSEQQRQAEIAGMQAVAALNRILRNAQDIERLVEGEVEDPNYQRHALSRVNESANDAVQIAEMLHELVARHVALIAMFQRAIEQRDEALQGQSAWLEEMVERMATFQMCSREQARKLLTVLLNSDEDLMITDEVLGLDNLIAFRDELQPLIEALEDA